MEEMRQLLFILGAGIPTLGGIGIFMIKKIMNLSERISVLETKTEIYHPKK